MAHYAWLDENNIVVNVTVGVDETELINGLDTETFYSQATGYNIKRTSYNKNIRANYAGIGYKYDPDFDVFIAPQPYPSWKLNYATYQWEAPVTKPDEVEGFVWRWSEINKEWIQVAIPQN
jgi:hypothetical protein